jgi:hypothetical protein
MEKEAWRLKRGESGKSPRRVRTGSAEEGKIASEVVGGAPAVLELARSEAVI